MAKVTVNPGICGLCSTFHIVSEDMQNVVIETSSDCPYIEKLGNEIMSLDGLTECFSKFEHSKVYSAANNHCKHLACPVPSAIIKGIEVACGFALPKEVFMNIEKE